MSASRAVPLSTLAKLGAGVLLPSALLCAWTLLLVLTGRGKEFAPFLVLMLSMIAIPLAMLLNTWTLFVSWRGPLRAFFAGLAFPVLTGAGLMMFLHGTPAQRRAMEAVLGPLGTLLQAAGAYPLVAFAAWVAAMLGLYLWAHCRARPARE